MYKCALNGYTIRLADNAYIPPAPENRDYQAYLYWMEQGNTPEPADPPIDGVPAFPTDVEPGHL